MQSNFLSAQKHDVEISFLLSMRCLGELSKFPERWRSYDGALLSHTMMGEYGVNTLLGGGKSDTV